MPERVLAVDDDAPMLKLVARELRSAGYHVDAAPTVREAWAMFEHARPAAAVLDIVIGPDSGVDLAARMREADEDLAIVFITGEPQVSTAQGALRVRAFDYLTKPVDMDALLRRAEQALAHRRLAIENRRHQRELERRYEELRELEASRAALAQTVIEDLARPLYDAANTLEIILATTGAGRPAEERDLLQLAAARMQEAREVGRRLSELFLIGQGERHVRAEPCRLAPVLQRARNGVRGGSLRLDASAVDESLEVLAEEALLKTALAALLEDVARGPAESVTAVAERSGDRVRLQLAAAGEPVGAAELSAVADPLADVSSKGGFVLTFARVAIEVQGGSIEAVDLGEATRALALNLPAV